MINLKTPEGVADYFESLKKISHLKFEEQLGKSLVPQSKQKKKRPIGFVLEGEQRVERKIGESAAIIIAR